MAISRWVLDHWDARDGAQDGVIEDPRQVVIDYAAVQVAAGLTGKQLDTLRALYRGPVNAAVPTADDELYVALGGGRRRRGPPGAFERRRDRQLSIHPRLVPTGNCMRSRLLHVEFDCISRLRVHSNRSTGDTPTNMLPSTFAFCSDPEELARAVTYGQAAAKHAMEVFAYGEAVRLLERALQVQDVLDPKNVRR